MTKDKVIEGEVVKKEDVFETFDKLDESQALAELKGAELVEYVYSFADKGVQVTGLSLVGVRETAREMNKRNLSRIGISDKAPIINETDEYIEVQTYAKDELNGGGYWGIKRQPKKFSTGTLNRFCMEQALSKAQRNAIRGLIPEPFVKEMISHYLGQGKGRDVTPEDVNRSVSTPKGTSKGKYPTNREYWDKYDWDKVKLSTIPPSPGYDKAKKKPKPAMESLKLYFYSIDILPKEEAGSFIQKIVPKKTYEMTYGEIQKCVKALMEVEDDIKDEGKQMEDITDEQLEMG